MFRISSNGKMQIIRGDTAEFMVDILNRDDTPYELQEGDEVVFSVKNKTSNDDRELIRKNGPYVRIESSDTSDLPFGKYYYDVQVRFADGSIDTIIPRNVFEIMEEVTR